MAQAKEPAVIEGSAVYVQQAGTPIFVKTADVCNITGKTNQWIGQLTSQGILHKVVTPHGSMYNLRDTLSAYITALEERANSEDPAVAENGKKRLEAEVAIKKAKAIIEAHKAKEIQGKMHRSEDVAAETEDLIFAVRGALLALPGRVAVDVAAATSPAEAAELIRKEVYVVMTELSQYKYDPKKYEERVRKRMNWEAGEQGSSDDEE